MRAPILPSRRPHALVLGTLTLALLGAGSASGIVLTALGSTSTTTTRSASVDGSTSTDPRSGPFPSLRTAGPFLLEEVRQKVGGEWGKAWESLHPLHQRIAPRRTFIRCETATPFAAPLESIHVVRARLAPVRVAGVLRAVPGVAVTVAVELRWYGPRDPITFRHTFHLVPVDGRWTWLLSPERYRTYLQGDCLTGPAS